MNMKALWVILPLMAGLIVFLMRPEDNVSSPPSQMPQESQAKVVPQASLVNQETMRDAPTETTTATSPGPSVPPTIQNDGTPPETKIKSPPEAPHFQMTLEDSTYHAIVGSATTDHGMMVFTSELLPTSEVKLDIVLEQESEEALELTAWLDLANFTMELDGGNRVLTKEHKQMLKQTADALKNKIIQQYDGYDIPEHALMLVQMLSYWSVSPEGFVHKKRTIVSR